MQQGRQWCTLHRPCLAQTFCGTSRNSLKIYRCKRVVGNFLCAMTQYVRMNSNQIAWKKISPVIWLNFMRTWITLIRTCRIFSTDRNENTFTTGVIAEEWSYIVYLPINTKQLWKRNKRWKYVNYNTRNLPTTIPNHPNPNLNPTPNPNRKWTFPEMMIQQESAVLWVETSSAV